MSNLTPQNEILNLSTSKFSSKTSKSTENSKTKTEINSSKTESQDNANENESFLNSLLKSIDESGEVLPEKANFSTNLSDANLAQELVSPEFSEAEQLSIFENAPLMEILSLLEKLKIDSSEVKLGNLSNQLSNLVKTEANLNTLKNASNLSELLELAKDLGLEIKKIKIDTLAAQNLKEQFPNLNKAEFFKSVDLASKELIQHKMLQNSHPEKTSQNVKANKNNNVSLLTQTLKNLDSITEKEPKKENLKHAKNEGEILDLKNKNIQINDDEGVKNLNLKETSKENKEPKNEVLKENKTQANLKTAEAEPKGNLKESVLKKENNEIKNALNLSPKEELKENLKTQDKKGEIKENSKEPKVANSKESKVEFKENKAEFKDSKIEFKENKEPKNEPLKENKTQANLKTTEAEPKANLKESVLKKENNEIKNALNLSPKEELKENLKTQDKKGEIKENAKEPKNAELKESRAEFKENKAEFKDSKEPKNEPLKENKTQINLKTDSAKEEIVKEQSPSKTPFLKENKEESTLAKDDFSTELTKDFTDKNDENELNSLVKDLSRTTQNQVKNTASAKESLQYFSQDLKEALEQYKPPITRLNITLNPSNLGEVEVTLIQRGNNLHINFNSNTNAMNLFIQNQLEFKNSLVNMGFTGLEMNFSDQSKKEQNQAQKQRANSKESLETKDESKIKLELVLAKYF